MSQVHLLQSRDAEKPEETQRATCLAFFVPATKLGAPNISLAARWG